MQIVENEQLTGKTIAIDEKLFVNCKYKNCIVVYTGGEWAWNNTTFENCQVTLSGAAQRTAMLLGNFGVIPPGTFPAPATGQIPKKPDGSVH